MKNMRKLFALVLAVIMVMSLATTAFAANEIPHTITINNSTEGYTYVAYQVFKGDLVDGELTGIEWGDNITDGAALLAALQKNEAFAACETVVDVATVLAANDALDAETTKAFADIVADYLTETVAGTSAYVNGEYTIPVTGDGYYLIKNTVVPGATEENAAGSYTRYILKVVGDVEVTHKGTVPSVDKEIVGGTTTETGDYSIGDTIYYKLTGTLPSNYADYDSYKYVFTDTMSAGLTYNKDAKVYVVNGETKSEITGSFTITATTDEETGMTTLVVSCDDLTAIEGVTIDANSKIVVEYTCTLNEGAVIGGEGNPNDVYLEFSNDPNYDGTGDKPTGETPKDEVVVFTFELDVTKVDGTDSAIKLEGAEFKLQNADEKWVIVDENGKVTGWADTQEGGSVLTSDENGFFKIVGLEDGTYNLVETKAPEGYNRLEEPIVIIITSTYDEEGVKTLTITVGDVTAGGNINNGVVDTIVKNNSGATLPETGGIGTTIFYTVGALLVLAAVILLVTKRRMNIAE